MIYTVTYNPAIDYVVHVRQLQAGSTNRSDQEELYFGGKGINVSMVLNELGIDSKALGFVAGFTGAAIENEVRQRGIAADFIRLDEGCSRINIKIKSEMETELNAQGPVISESAQQKLLNQIETLQDGDTLVLAGSIPCSMPDDTYEKALSRLAGKQVQTIVDTAGSLLLHVLPYRPFLIKPNLQELAELFGVTLDSRAEIAHYAAKLQEQGAKNVLVSMAGSGALLLDEYGKIHFCPGCRGTVRNSVGAGDSMVAGFLAGFLERGDYSYALQLGSAAGGATAFSEGLAERKLIYRMLRQLQEYSAGGS
ncbi:MAG: 1-phosphofructokinase [Lachnospiraceae bacterium]|nr:1-phosphofructokinase [Lachnospiraceae bacterium]